jgi:hypothetical protein
MLIPKLDGHLSEFRQVPPDKSADLRNAAPGQELG